MRLSLFTAIHHHLPLHEALRLLHAEGWRAFEIATEHLEAIEAAPDPLALVDEALAAAATLNVELPQAHILLGADVAAADADARATDIRRLRVHIGLAARLGVKVVVMHPGGKGAGVVTTATERNRIRAANVEAIRPLADEAAGLGMRIGLENMMRRGFSSPAEMLELLEAVDHPAVGFTLDTSHVHWAGYNLADYVREMGARLIATHLSDNDGSGDQHRAPGNGKIDWAGFKRAIREIGYDGYLNLEIGGERHPDPDLQRLKLRHALRVAEWLAAPG